MGKRGFQSRYANLNGLTKSGHRSKFEDNVVLALQQVKAKHTYEPKEAKITYTVQATYAPDIMLANYLLLEVKGWFKPEDRRKMAAVKESHPTLDIRFIFQNAYSPISKGSKMQNWSWAEKYGYKWSHAGIPVAWINEPICETNKQFIELNKERLSVCEKKQTRSKNT